MCVRAEKWTGAMIVVGMLMLPSSQCFALTVEIIHPETDPFEVTEGTEIYFEAVAYDEAQEDVSDQVTWEWDFGDNETSQDNPVLHTYDSAGDYQVTVTGTLGEDQAQDTMTCQIQAAEEAAEGWLVFLGREVDTNKFESDDSPTCDGRAIIVHEPPGAGHIIDTVDLEWMDNDQVWHQVDPVQGTRNIWLDDVYRADSAVFDWLTQGYHDETIKWQIVVHTAAGEQPAQDIDLGVRSWLVHNTTIKGHTGVLQFDPEDEDADDPTVSWSIDHENKSDPYWDVHIYICDLAGNAIFTHVEEDQHWEQRDGDWQWHGELTGGGTASKGIYTYKLWAVGQGPGHGLGECDDQDKSEQLEVAVDHFYRLHYDPETELLTTAVVYELTRDAGDVTIEFFGPELTLLYEEGDQSKCKGENWSGVFQFAVPADENDEPVAPIYCVVSAVESADDARLNRDRQAKPALQKGTTQLEPLSFDLHIDRAPEEDEETLGAFVLLNNDDDNESQVADNEDPLDEPVANENDLKRMIVWWDRDEVKEGTLTLDCTAGGDKIGDQVYDSPNRERPTTLPLEIGPLDRNPPLVFWIEGYEISQTPRDVVFEFKWEKNEVLQLEDIVKVTIWDAEIDKCPGDWIPEGTPEAPGEATATCRILPVGVEGLIRFHLDSTRMPGYCMNAPLPAEPDEGEPDWDLQFNPDQTGFSLGYVVGEETLWQTATTDSPVTQAEVAVDCLDYGACAVVKALVRVEDTLDQAHVPGDWAYDNPRIPRDEDENYTGNYIADCWDWNAGKADDDAETIQGKGDPNFPGDGLSRYEEYRGFIIAGTHTRTDPDANMDVFLIDEDGLGTGFFEATGLTLHVIAEGEAGIDRETGKPWSVNFNSGIAHVLDQHGIIYVDGGYHPDEYGDAGYVGVPNVEPGQAAAIYTQTIRKDSPTHYDKTTPDPPDADAFAEVIAHELGHRVAIKHHDPKEGGDDDCAMISGAGLRWGDPRNSYCTQLLPPNPPNTETTGDCLHRWRLHD